MSTYKDNESLAKAIKELCLKEPFYGLLLMSLNKVWSTSVPTLGVCLRNINYELAINSEFWNTLTVIQKPGLIKHEALHIGFFHLLEYSSYTDKQVLNCAMDIEINQYIDRKTLPENGCYLENFPELNMEKKMGTRYYYEKLKAEKDKNSAIFQAIADAIADGKSTCQLPNGQTIEIPDHDWSDIEALPDATKKLIDSQTKHIINQVAEQVVKARGTIPGEFRDVLARINKVEPPKFDWKGYIRRFVGKSTKTYTKKSRRKLNKRIIDYPGLRIKKQKHILAAIDTSGSVSIEELKEFLGELYHLQKNGAEVTILECDSAISYIGKYDPKRDLPLTGRGGTNFDPPVNYYNERRNQFSCLIYFTDGECSPPEAQIKDILWVLSSTSTMNNDLPGNVIKLEI
jgi:predicted metal-dependent peptidase